MQPEEASDFAVIPEIVLYPIEVDNAKPVVHRDTSQLTGDAPDARRRHHVSWHLEYATTMGFSRGRTGPATRRRGTRIRREVCGAQFAGREGLRRVGGGQRVVPRWATTVADLGRTRPRTIASARAALTAYASRPRALYYWERVRHRVVAIDAVVAVGGSRYSWPRATVSMYGCRWSPDRSSQPPNPPRYDVSR